MTESTTIKVSKNTSEELEKLKIKMGAKSVDEIIMKLVRENRSRLIEEAFGIDKGRLRGFTEEDRGEDRH